MTNTNIIRLTALVSSASCFAVLYVLFWDTTPESAKLFSFGQLSFLLGFFIYFPTIGCKSKTISGSLSRIGSGAWFGFVALCLSLLGTALLLKGQASYSIAVNITAVFSTFLSISTSLITSQHVDSVNEFKNYSSDHRIWATKLDTISDTVANIETKKKIKRLAEDMGYLARDNSNEKLKINTQISSAIDFLSKALERNDENDINVQLTKISLLAKEREEILKKMRSQV